MMILRFSAGGDQRSQYTLRTPDAISLSFIFNLYLSGSLWFDRPLVRPLGIQETKEAMARRFLRNKDLSGKVSSSQ